MTTGNDIHPFIGLHEGKEFQLLDAGRKHIAFFYEIIPDKYFIYKERNEFGCIEWEDEVTGRYGSKVVIPYVILYRRTHRQDAERLAVLKKSDGSAYHQSEEYEVGKILSYSQEAVEYYIARSNYNRKIRMNTKT